MCLAMAFFTACEKDELASEKHVYTEEEQRYRDSIEAARAGVKADVIITEDVDVVEGQWSSTTVPLNPAVIEGLGYADAAAFAAAFGAFDGAVTLLAVNPATGADASDHQVDTPGVQEGFLFTPSGEPGAGWDNPGEVNRDDQFYSMYAMYNINDVAFYVGMRTGKLKLGETYKIILLFKKGEYRVALIYNVTIVSPEEEDPNAYVADETIVQDVVLVSTSIESNASTAVSLNGALAGKLGYANTEALSTALGELVWNTQVGNEVTFFGVNASTGIDYTGAYTAGMGYWYTAAGDICAYSDADAALYVDLDPVSLRVTVGQKGGQVDAGETYRLIVMFANAANYRVAVELNVTPVIDTPPAGEPYELSVIQTVVKTITGDWDQLNFDVTGVLRDAFKLTTAEINAAIASKTMTFYANNDPTQTSTSSGNDYPGHWFNEDETIATNYADGEIFLRVVPGENIQFMLQNQPSNANSPMNITAKQTAELNGGKINFTFNVVLVSGNVVPYEADYAASVTVLQNNDYATAFDVTSVLTAAFQKTPGEIAAAIAGTTLEFYALESGSADQKESSANYPGHWFAADGTVTNWGTAAVLFAELRVENENAVLNIGNYPNAAAGVVTFRQVAKLNGGQVNLTFTVNLVNP
jgi:hypothetical protein